MSATGIDVAARLPDIRRIVGKYFRVQGLDLEDLIGDVVLRLLEQNRLPCAYDPRRGAFSKYVYMVAFNVVSKRLRRDRSQARLMEALASVPPTHGATVEDLVAAAQTG